MAIQTINIGNYANDGTGDDLRTAFQKVNANFQELNVDINVASAENVGSGVGLYKGKNGPSLDFKTLTSTDNSVTYTTTNNTVNLKANTVLQSDLNPRLGGNLHLNNFYVEGGDVQATVFGLNVLLLNSLIASMLETNQVNIDLGSIPSPTGSGSIVTGYPLDFGYILNHPGNTYDFGSIV